MLANTLFENGVERLQDIAARVSQALESAGIPYRILGGYATFLYVEEREPINARLTSDVDIAVARTDLKRIADAAAKCGLKYRHTAGIDMLVDAKEPKARTGVYMIFVREKVRPEYVESVPDFGKESRRKGLLLAAASPKSALPSSHAFAGITAGAPAISLSSNS
ncbi:MAG TPA: hypothetical protein VKS01_13120 [Bryobacteraceae bacterium]|nr:hypothetical protein [Bryobacteraceae bacterium]